MMNQVIMCRLILVLARNHPHMHDDFMKMAQEEIAEFITAEYGCKLAKGTDWEDVAIVTDIMDKRYKAMNP